MSYPSILWDNRGENMVYSSVKLQNRGDMCFRHFRILKRSSWGSNSWPFHILVCFLKTESRVFTLRDAYRYLAFVAEVKFISRPRLSVIFLVAWVEFVRWTVIERMFDKMEESEWVVYLVSVCERNNNTKRVLG